MRTVNELPKTEEEHLGRWGGEERTSRLMWFSNDGGETEILDGDGGGEAEKPRRQYRGIRNFTRWDVVVLLDILLFLVFLLGVF